MKELLGFLLGYLAQITEGKKDSSKWYIYDLFILLQPPSKQLQMVVYQVESYQSLPGRQWHCFFFPLLFSQFTIFNIFFTINIYSFYNNIDFFFATVMWESDKTKVFQWVPWLHGIAQACILYKQYTALTLLARKWGEWRAATKASGSAILVKNILITVLVLETHSTVQECQNPLTGWGRQMVVQYLVFNTGQTRYLWEVHKKGMSMKVIP